MVSRGHTRSTDMKKTVVITGCTRGLGLSMAREFARRGWTVSGCGTRTDAVNVLAKELGNSHLVLRCDVTDPAAVAMFATATLEVSGAPDLLINNAAVVNQNAPLWKVPIEEFSRLIDVNIKGIHHVCHAFLPAMIKRGTGVIVNLSSGWGRSTAPDVAPYCASKWAVEGLTRALAQDLPSGLAAVPLNPGIIDTDMLRCSFGVSAGDFPSPARWAERAVPFLEKLGPSDNGRPLSAP